MQVVRIAWDSSWVWYLAVSIQLPRMVSTYRYLISAGHYKDWSKACYYEVDQYLTYAIFACLPKTISSISRLLIPTRGVLSLYIQDLCHGRVAWVTIQCGLSCPMSCSVIRLPTWNLSRSERARRASISAAMRRQAVDRFSSNLTHMQLTITWPYCRKSQQT